MRRVCGLAVQLILRCMVLGLEFASESLIKGLWGSCGAVGGKSHVLSFDAANGAIARVEQKGSCLDSWQAYSSSGPVHRRCAAPISRILFDLHLA